AGRDGSGGGLQAQPFIGVQGRELAEVHTGAGSLRGHPIDRVELDQGGVLALAALVAAGAAAAGVLVQRLLIGRAIPLASLARAVAAHLVHRHVHVAGAGRVAGGAHVGVVVANVQDPGDGDELVTLAHLVVVRLTPLVLAALTVRSASTTLAVPRPVAAAGAT